MVTFPAWVDDSRDEDDRAARRLRYLVIRASNWCTSSGSIASLADHCGIQRTQIHAAIKDGRFSAKMAAQIERKCGREVVRRDWLTYPLEAHALT